MALSPLNYFHYFTLSLGDVLVCQVRVLNPRSSSRNSFRVCRSRDHVGEQAV